MKDYKEIWNNLSTSFADASFYVCCIDDEDEIRSNGAKTTTFLKEVLQIGPDDKVLEIGCGVARIGRELARDCGEWHGVDISGNMIAYAMERTRGIPNIFLYELPENSLSIFPDNYFDCVYSSIVFMHLDKYDMFSYIREAHRVLAPGGRCYFDTYNILAPEAWEHFLKTLNDYPSHLRPGHVSQFSTPQELRKFMEEAGFEAIHVDGDSNPQLVLALGRKADQPDFKRSELTVRPGTISKVTVDVTARNNGRSLTAEIASLRADIEVLNEHMQVKSQHIEELERIISIKNAHIKKLERRVHSQQRVLDVPLIRLMARLSDLLSPRRRR